MNQDKNYWDSLFVSDYEQSTDNVIAYFTAQAELLKKSSEGKVTAVLDRKNALERENNLLVNISETVQTATRAVEVTSGLTPRRRDANDLYIDGSYAFEIRSRTYRFRVLEFELCALYPVNVVLDEGVFEEIDSSIRYRFKTDDSNQDCSLAIQNDEDLDMLFKAILDTRKVRFLVNKLYLLAK